MNANQVTILRRFCRSFGITVDELRTWITAAVDAQPHDYMGDGLLPFADAIGAKTAGDADPDQPPSYNELMRELDQLVTPYEPEPPSIELNDALIIYRCMIRGVPIEHIATVLAEYERELVRCGATDPDELMLSPEQWRSFAETVAANPGLFSIDPNQSLDDDSPNSSPAR